MRLGPRRGVEVAVCMGQLSSGHFLFQLLYLLDQSLFPGFPLPPFQLPTAARS